MWVLRTSLHASPPTTKRAKAYMSGSSTKQAASCWTNDDDDDDDDAMLRVPVEGRGKMSERLVLSCLVFSLECTLWEGFFWRMPKQAYTVPCRASHPRGQGAQISCT